VKGRDTYKDVEGRLKENMKEARYHAKENKTMK
jgi:hypothetical protein